MNNNKIINIDNLCWESWQHSNQYASHQKHIGDAAGCRQIGVTMERLEPGKISSVAHYHTKEEEHLYALQGEATLFINGEPHDFKQGDYICFTANSGVSHTLKNESDADFLFLVLGNRDPHDVVVYPEHNKVQVRSIDEIYAKRPTNYWDPDH
ncbi:cupin domain-containing protein [Shewanella marisflavi]|uniref:Cupin n=1 Tax=Shewanella marisflavi TaxID=260364 RepID=A0AAC9XP94_9GAMM|nr:cupin domain-containing protein [Shewanella marisflavi]ASJ97821.1 cupin [Shewanella marisflavi]